MHHYTLRMNLDQIVYMANIVCNRRDLCDRRLDQEGLSIDEAFEIRKEIWQLDQAKNVLYEALRWRQLTWWQKLGEILGDPI